MRPRPVQTWTITDPGSGITRIHKCWWNVDGGESHLDLRELAFEQFEGGSAVLVLHVDAAGAEAADGLVDDGFLEGLGEVGEGGVEEFFGGLDYWVDVVVCGLGFDCDFVEYLVFIEVFGE